MLHIIGRKDNTVKISGYRIDTKEIENLTSLGDIDQEIFKNFDYAFDGNGQTATKRSVESIRSIFKGFYCQLIA